MRTPFPWPGEVRYDAAYTFIYSPRVGTRAAAMPDDTPRGGEEPPRITAADRGGAGASVHETLQAQVGKRETRAGGKRLFAGRGPA